MATVDMSDALLPKSRMGNVCTQCHGSLAYKGGELRCNTCGLPHKPVRNEPKPTVQSNIKPNKEVSDRLKALPTRCQDLSCGSHLVIRGMTLVCSKCGIDHTPGKEAAKSSRCQYPINTEDVCNGTLKVRGGDLLCTLCRRTPDAVSRYLKELNDKNSISSSADREQTEVSLPFATMLEEEISESKPSSRKRS